MVLRTFELLLLYLLGFGTVSEKSDISLVFMHSLFQYFDSVFVWIFFFRCFYILLRIFCMPSSCMFGNVCQLLLCLKDNLAILDDCVTLFSYTLVDMSSLTPSTRSSYREE